MKHLPTLFIALLLCFGALHLHAQKPFKDGYKRLRLEKFQQDKTTYHRPVQLTLISPIGTNGLKSSQCINHLSINLIGGVSAATEGVEMGGLVNINRMHTYGVQLAGFGNVTGDDAIGLQMAGFGNIVGADLYAVQIGGFGNIAGGKVYNAQIAGFGNIAGSHVGGLQLAGFGNVAGGNVSGGQIAGFGNVAEKVTGLQLAGFGNVAGDVNGAQIAGAVNVAKHVKGFQLGLVNVAEEMDGVPFGLLSFVKKDGYCKMEVTTSEALNAQVAWKMGVEDFYNIFAVGGRYTEEQNYFSFGYGIGTQFHPFNNSILANLEIMSWHVNEGYKRWMTDLNLLNQLKFTVGLPLFNEAITLFAGPTYNVMVSNSERALELNDTGIAPLWTFQDRVYGHTRIQQWVGMNVGLRF